MLPVTDESVLSGRPSLRGRSLVYKLAGFRVLRGTRSASPEKCTQPGRLAKCKRKRRRLPNAPATTALAHAEASADLIEADIENYKNGR